MERVGRKEKGKRERRRNRNEREGGGMNGRKGKEEKKGNNVPAVSIKLEEVAERYLPPNSKAKAPAIKE